MPFASSRFPARRRLLEAWLDKLDDERWDALFAKSQDMLAFLGVRGGTRGGGRIDHELDPDALQGRVGRHRRQVLSCDLRLLERPSGASVGVDNSDSGP